MARFVIDHHFFPTQTEPLLLMALGSDVPADTDVVPQIDPTDERHGTLIVACRLAPVGMFVHEQVTLCPATEQLALPVVTIDGAGPVNRLDVTVSTTFWLSLGPALVTVTVKVAVPLPAFPTVLAVCVTARSAWVCTEPQVVEELFAETGSAVAVVTVAVLHSWLASLAEAASLRTTLNDAVVAGASAATEQLIDPEELTAGVVHVQPPTGVRDVNVVPDGSVSPIETVRAVLGPALATTIV